MTLILVDCEGHGPAAGLNDDQKFEFGAVEFETRTTFHGVGGMKVTFEAFDQWLRPFADPLVFVSDNPAYDWQFINYYFHKFLGRNPFGHSARRIGDFYAGVRSDWRAPGRDWKKYRRTAHDHHPVHDAQGNAEALQMILAIANDWTIDPATNRSNSSPEFLYLVEEVGRLIRDDAHTLLCGHSDATAGLIMAQLAHQHGLAPRRKI